METQEIELREILQILVRRLWILLLMPAVATVAAGVFSYYYLQPVYQTSATIWIKGESGDVSYSRVMTNESLAHTYAEVARSLVVANAAAARLGRPDVSPEQLRGQLSVSPVRNTEIVQLMVTDTDPELAALKANAIVDAFKQEIEASEMVQNIRVVDYATVPGGPIKPRPMMNMMLAFVLGLMAAVGLSFLLEYLDTSVRTAEDLTRRVGGPVLATIPFVHLTKEPSLKRPNRSMNPIIFTHKDTYSAAAEAVRVLRANLQFLALDAPLKSILVTSAAPSEGKSVTSANLAVALAQAGARVCLVDADLRLPTQAKLFGLENRSGLTNVLLGVTPLQDALKQPVEGLFLLTSGPLPPNPSEMLGTARMERLLRDLESEFDYVILDSTPTLGLADAVTLASRVDGVLLVARSGGVGYPEVVRARDVLRGIKAKLLGLVLEGVREKQALYYYSKYYRKAPDQKSTEATG